MVCASGTTQRCGVQTRGMGGRCAMPSCQGLGVWDERWHDNNCHFNTTCGTHTSETVTGGTPHACPCFIHSMVCATTTTLRDTSEAWWHQHTLTCMAVRCGVWPMLCHSCLHHHLHPPITSPQSISLCHVFTHVCVCDHGIHHAFAFQWCMCVGMGFVMRHRRCFCVC